MTNDEIYERILEEISNRPLLKNGTRELLCPNVIEFNPFVRLTRAKQSYVDAELAWYLSMERNIKAQPVIARNPIWQNCAAPDGSVNSNYGWCVFSEENSHQYNNAVQSLLKDPFSRQSVCVYIRPEIQTIHDDGIHAKHDFICTFCTHHFIRDNRLEYIVYMRSNDIEYGLPYDLAWHQYVFKNMWNDLTVAGELSDKPEYKYLAPGSIWWHASSLHKYERNMSTGSSLA
jgi:thymidylate synthase